MPRQQYSRELKIASMREIDSGKGIAEVARMYGWRPGKGSGEPRASWRSLRSSAAAVVHSVPVHGAPVTGCVDHPVPLPLTVMGDFEAPGRFNGSPTLLELGGIGFIERMSVLGTGSG